jgi:hypothetical protein
MFRSLTRLFGKRSARSSSRRAPSFLSVEQLEERCQPSVASYSSYLGGDTSDEVTCVTTDAAGYIYLAGRAGSNNFPGIPGPKPFLANGFVAKMNPAGQLLWATYADSDTDGVRGIAVDRSGNIYATGSTELATGFATAGAAQTSFGGWEDAFAMKLSASGSVLYATYIGGSQLDVAYGIAVDGDGDAYVTGYTISDNFPTVNPLPGQGALHANSGEDAFVTEINPSGSQFLFSTYLGGNANNPNENGATLSQAHAITLDAAGNIYLTGYTLAADFPTVNAFQAHKGYGADAFVTELRAVGPSGSQIVYSTFLGDPSTDVETGSGTDIGNGIAVDAAGNIVVVGDTDSAHFPTKNAFQTRINGNGLLGLDDAFITRLNPTRAPSQQLIYSTYLGGNAADDANAVALDAAGDAWVLGDTNSDQPVGHFPLVNAFQTRFNAGAFVAEFSPSGKALLSSYYGGGGENGEGISVDGFGNVVFVGHTESDHLPTTANAYQRTFPGESDSGFVAILAGANKSYSGKDQAGDLISVTLTGPGAISVVRTATGMIQAIYLVGTSSNSSVLTITVTRKTGNGLVQIGSITGTGLAKLVAPSADLVGSGINLTGVLGSLTIHVIGDGATINVVGGLGLLQAAKIGAATIVAPRLTTLTVTGDRTRGLRGDFAAALTLTGTGTALGTAKIAGEVIGSSIVVQAGSVTSFTAGAFVNSTLFLGQAGQLTAGASLGTFTVTGLTGLAAAFVNSNVSASIVGSVTLASVQTNNGGVAFGITAHQSIARVVVTSPKFTYNPKLTTPQGIGDFVVQRI